MINLYGSGREWQKAMTYKWVEKILNEYSDKKLVLIEGQVDLLFIVSAFKYFKFTKYKIILVHCDKQTRHHRLLQNRIQPELINDMMDNWSDYLFKQAIEIGVPILDTTSISTNQLITWFKKYIPFI